MKRRHQKEILDKLYDLLLKTPLKLRKPIIDAILFLEWGTCPKIFDNEPENDDHPHWECGDK